MSEHPLAPPPTPGAYAGFVTRLIAITIDLLIITGFNTILTFIGGFMVEFFQVSERTTTLVTILGVIVAVFFFILYFVVLWMLAGQTIGKAIMGLRIVRTDGERINLQRAVIRLAGYWLSAFLFLGYLWALVDSRRQTFHDKLAGTFVIYADPFRERQNGRQQKRLEAYRKRHQFNHGSG
jgi:uncharacterized RDD family membrane protein YckC